MSDKILIIDGMNMVWRGAIKFGFLKPDVNHDFTIVYNFFRNLRALLEQFEPTKCFLVLEGNPQFRKQLFPDYKRKRSLVKEGSKQTFTRADVLRQSEVIVQLLAYLPIIVAKSEHYEADDTIYALAHNLRDEEVIVVSSDSDLIQLLQSLRDHNIKLYHPGKKEYIAAPDYVYLVWKSLAGDTSDDIPSVTSKKKALELATTPEALQQFLAVEENRADFSLNKQLIELQLVPSEQVELRDYKVDFQTLFLKFEEMKLRSLLEEPYKQRFIDTFKGLH